MTTAVPVGITPLTDAEMDTLETLLPPLAVAAVQALRADRDALVPLARLGSEALDVSRNGGCCDAIDIHESAVKMGVIAPVTVSDACDPDHCICAEMDTLPTTCFRDTPATERAIGLLAAIAKAEGQ